MVQLYKEPEFRRHSTGQQHLGGGLRSPAEQDRQDEREATSVWRGRIGPQGANEEAALAEEALGPWRRL